jgi:hypothetical protein
MSTSQDPSQDPTQDHTQDPTQDSDQIADQDAEPPGDGIAGPVHPDDPAEGPDDEAVNPA